MAKVIIFSREFPKYHPKVGEPTDFVAKFWANKGVEMLNTELLPEDYINVSKIGNLWYPKKHTIRSGNRFKKGDFFSPRVWSGKPYNSKQIIISPDTEVLQTWEIEIFHSYEVYIDGVFHCSLGSKNWEELCKNDGLNSGDMRDWFCNLPFKGQIICWNQNVNY